jgi:hypothetical protein
VLAEFDRIIARAKAHLEATTVPTAKRTSLNDTEIKRMAEYVYAEALASDERARFSGRDEMKRMEAEIIRREGAVDPPRIPWEQWPLRGVPREIYEENRDALLEDLPMFREAAAMGDTSIVQDHVMLALATFNIELDERTQAYNKLSRAASPNGPPVDSAEPSGGIRNGFRGVFS